MFISRSATTDPTEADPIDEGLSFAGKPAQETDHDTIKYYTTIYTTC